MGKGSKKVELMGTEMGTCEKCAMLAELYNGTDKSPRLYWVMTELFVWLHGGDMCRGGRSAKAESLDPNRERVQEWKLGVQVGETK